MQSSVSRSLSHNISVACSKSTLTEASLLVSLPGGAEVADFYKPDANVEFTLTCPVSPQTVRYRLKNCQNRQKVARRSLIYNTFFPSFEASIIEIHTILKFIGYTLYIPE